MPRRRIFAFAGTAALLVAAVLFAAHPTRQTEKRPNELQNYVRSTVLTLSYGAEANQVGQSLDVPEQMPLGPQSFAIDHGSVTILDTLNESVKRFGETGQLINQVEVGRGTDMIESSAGDLLVADPVSKSVVRISGTSTERFSTAEAIESFSTQTSWQGDRRLVRVISEAAVPPSSQYSSRLVGDHDGVIEQQGVGKQLHVHTAQRLGSINVLGLDRTGNIYVVLEELLPGASTDVQRTIRKLSADGTTLANIGIPIDNSTFPARDLLVDDAGTIYHMQPRREHLIVEKWEQQ